MSPYQKIDVQFVATDTHVSEEGTKDYITLANSTLWTVQLCILPSSY